jgi:hypothetical protein
MATVQKEKPETRQQFGNFAQNVGDQAKELAHETGDKAKELGASMAQKAGDAASFVGKKADEATSFVGKKADEATSSVAAGMKNLAGTIRENTPDMIGSAGCAVADTLESGSRYLQEQGLKGIGEDVANVIRRNPIPALLVGIGVGFLLARATSSRS